MWGYLDNALAAAGREVPPQPLLVVQVRPAMEEGRQLWGSGYVYVFKGAPLF